MSLFNPIAKQYDHLMSGWRGRISMPLDEAAGLMGIAPTQVAHNLVQMEQKGMFPSDTPYVDLSTSLVIRDRTLADYAVTIGLLDRIAKEVEKAKLAVPKMLIHQQSEKREDNAKQFGRAILNFASGAVDGKKFRQNLKDSTRSYFDNCGSYQATDIRNLLLELDHRTEELQDYARQNPGNLYPERLRDFLKELCDTLKEWHTVTQRATTSQDWETVDFLTDKLQVEYLNPFPTMAALAYNKPVTHTPAEDVISEIDSSAAYLDSIKDSIYNFRIRAAVLRIGALLQQVRAAYEETDAQYSRSDAKSLKNIYLPTLRSLLEKYMAFEQLRKPGESPDNKAEETIGVLENELPRALITIRDNLRNTHASAMEDEATALRQKLEMDGLL